VRDGLTTFEAKRDVLLQVLRANGIDYGIVIPDNVRESAIGSLQQCLTLFENDKRFFLVASVNILRQFETVSLRW
jgi:hypothetical protein